MEVWSPEIHSLSILASLHYISAIKKKKKYTDLGSFAASELLKVILYKLFARKKASCY